MFTTHGIVLILLRLSLIYKRKRSHHCYLVLEIYSCGIAILEKALEIYLCLVLLVWMIIEILGLLFLGSS